MTPQEIRQKIVRRERWVKLGILFLVISLSLTILLAVSGMLVSFLLAFVITYMFKPIVSNLERRGIGHTMSVMLPFLFSFLIIMQGAMILVPKVSEQIATLETELPKYIEGINALSAKHTQKINRFLSGMMKVDFSAQIGQKAQSQMASTIAQIPNIAGQVLTALILSPLFAFFMLRDGRAINKQLLSVVPNNLFEAAMNLFYQINQQLGGFIRARILESFIVGGVVWLGLYMINVPYAFLLAAFAGLTNLIPYLGPIIGAVPGLLLAAINPEISATPFSVGVVYLIAQIVDMVFVIPFVVAKIVDLHPVSVIIVIIVGGELKGILGMIISVPVASIIKLTFTQFYNHVVDFQR